MRYPNGLSQSEAELIRARDELQIVYVVDPHGNVAALTIEQYAALPAGNSLRNYTVCLTVAEQQAEVARRLARRCRRECCAP